LDARQQRTAQRDRSDADDPIQALCQGHDEEIQQRRREPHAVGARIALERTGQVPRQ